MYLPLDNPDTHVQRGDQTYLRLQISGTPATGRNGLRVADGSDGVHAGPQLVLLGCLPAPTPTPPPGCHIDTFTPAANGWTAWGEGSSYPPPFDHCENDQMGRLVGNVYMDFPWMQGWYGANSLFQWDTSTLPADAVVSGVSFKAVVLPLQSGDAASLTADWYDWGTTCGSEDYTTTTDLGDALSTDGACGDACLLANIPAARDVEFPLDDAAAHLSRSAEAPTQLRVRVDMAETPANDVMGIADLSSPWAPPRLIVRWCESDAPTPGPTPTPTQPLRGSCELNEECSAGTCVSDLTELECAATATNDNCAALSWSPNASDCSAPAPNTGCCVVTGFLGSMCAGNADGSTFMGLTEASCEAICETLLGAALPGCVATAWGYGQDCGDSPYSGCVAVNTPTPAPPPTPAG